MKKNEARQIFARQVDSALYLNRAIQSLLKDIEPSSFSHCEYGVDLSTQLEKIGCAVDSNSEDLERQKQTSKTLSSSLRNLFSRDSRNVSVPRWVSSLFESPSSSERYLYAICSLGELLRLVYAQTLSTAISVGEGKLERLAEEHLHRLSLPLHSLEDLLAMLTVDSKCPDTYPRADQNRLREDAHYRFHFASPRESHQRRFAVSF